MLLAARWPMVRRYWRGVTGGYLSRTYVCVCDHRRCRDGQPVVRRLHLSCRWTPFIYIPGHRASYICISNDQPYTHTHTHLHKYHTYIYTYLVYTCICTYRYSIYIYTPVTSIYMHIYIQIQHIHTYRYSICILYIQRDRVKWDWLCGTVVTQLTGVRRSLTHPKPCIYVCRCM